MVGGESDLEEGMNRCCPQEFLSEDSVARGEAWNPHPHEASGVHFVSELLFSLLVSKNPLHEVTQPVKHTVTQPGGHRHTARKAHNHRTRREQSHSQEDIVTQPGGHTHTARKAHTYTGRREQSHS